MEKKYNIIYSGKIGSGQNVDAVKQNLSRLMKKSEEKIDLLFSGKPFVLKKNVDPPTAEKYQAAFKKIGAICELQVVPDDSDLSNLTMETPTSGESDTEKPVERLFVCPKCGFQQVYSDKCQQCGILFSKLLEEDSEEDLEKQPPQQVISEELEQGVARAKAIGEVISANSKQGPNMRQIFRLARIGLVFLIFLAVASYTFLTNRRIAGWEETLDVVIYPINGDNSAQTDEFISNLDVESFRAIETFMMEEAEGYGLPLEKPVAIYLAPKIKSLPPDPPKNRSRLKVMWWSLKMRYWAFKHNTYDDALDIRLYVIYKTIESDVPRMEVSVGLRKGYMGIVNTSPGAQSQDYTNIIITHEMLHTLDAKDKYDYATLMPNFPEGYAEPEKEPRHPQSHAEIMAVRIPESQNSFYMPESLDEVIIGEETCTEIKWCDEEGS